MSIEFSNIFFRLQRTWKSMCKVTEYAHDFQLPLGHIAFDFKSSLELMYFLTLPADLKWLNWGIRTS